MTLKFSRLETFTKELKMHGYLLEISDVELRLQVARTFDVVSDYAIGSVIKALHKFGFIEQTVFGIWKIAGLHDKRIENKTEDEAIDKLIGADE